MRMTTEVTVALSPLGASTAVFELERSPTATGSGYLNLLVPRDREREPAVDERIRRRFVRIRRGRGLLPDRDRAEDGTALGRSRFADHGTAQTEREALVALVHGVTFAAASREETHL